MAKQYKREQVIQNPFTEVNSGLNETAKLLAAVQNNVDALNASLKNISTQAGVLKSAMGGDVSGNSLDEINKINKAHAEALKLLKEEQRLKNEKALAEAKLSAIEEAAARKREEHAAKMARHAQLQADRDEKARVRAEKLAAAEAKKAEAYSRVDGWLKKLSAEHRNLAVRQELGGKLTAAEIKRMDTLEGRIQRYDAALKKVDATQGKHQRNVGNYAGAWNGLGNSVQQLSRELPAFGNSIQTGFMAISNNLPMFFDEIQKIRIANQQLAASGMPTVSVMKQIGQSIFSTAGLLSLGVTALTLFGSKLVEMIFNTDKETKALKEQQRIREYQNEQTKKHADFIAQESYQYVGYLLQLKKTNAGSKERSNLIKEINDKYGTTLKNIRDEAKFQSILNAEIEKYILFQRARFEVQKNEELIQKNLAKQDKLRIETAKELGITVKQLDEFASASYKAGVASQQGIISKSGPKRIAEYNNELINLNERLENYGLNLLNANEEVGDYDYKTEKAAKSTKEFTLALEDNNDELERRLNLGEQERKLIQEILQLNQDAQIDTVSRIAEQEFQNQLEFAKQQGEIFVDTLEMLLNEEFDLREAAAKERSDFALTELQKSFDAERVLAFEELEKQRDELLKQEGLTANGRRAILTDYQRKVDQLNIEYLERERILALEREKIELELQQQLGNLSRERVDRLNEVNDQSIDAQMKYAEESNKLAEDERKKKADADKKELEAKKKYYQELLRVSKKVVDDIFDYEIKDSQRRQKLLDENIAASEKQSDYLAEKAAQGNLAAEESLKKQQEITNKYRDQRREEEERQAALEQAKKYAEMAINITNNLIQQGENPIQAAGKGVGIVQVIKALFGKGFFFGTDDTGNKSPISDEFGAITGFTHENEQVWSKKDRDDVDFATRQELKDAWKLVNSPQMIFGKVPAKQDTSHSPITRELIGEVKSMNRKLDKLPNEFFTTEVIDGVLTATHNRIVQNTTYKRFNTNA